MAATQFNLITQWQLDAPIEQVWAALSKPEHWPSWWKAVIAVETLERGDADDIGTYRRMTWRTALPYRISFNMRTIRIEKPHVIEGVADGDLEGRGRWQLERSGEGTTVRYDWTVETSKAWMKMIAPLARPMFEWNHGVVMGWGREGIERQLLAQMHASPHPLTT